jgi:phosphohistidine phosphatase
MSFELVVVRHAIAFERDPERWSDDGLRPLSPDGKRKFQQAASGLSRWIPEVDRVFTSPLVRATQTAELLTALPGWPKAALATELLPEEDASAPLALAKRGDVKRLAVVGHEPQLSALIALCVTTDLRLRLALKKGGVALIQFEDRPAAGRGRLLALMPPLVLRRMA